MALIPNHIIAEIRERSDLVAIIGEHVPLRRSGANYQGLCPFHPEKSPSFTVSPAKGFFYCFGCHKTGDVFRFLVDLTGRSFVEVAKDLASRAGVIIPEPPPDSRTGGSGRSERGRDGRPASSGGNRQDELRQLLLRLNELATRYFEAELGKNERARAYLEKRGVSAELAARFRLGYAPDAWDGLLRLFAQKNVPHELAELAGLLIRRGSDSQSPPPLPRRAPAASATHYDRFRDRIMFPLLVPMGGRAATTLGDVVAFGGRVLPSAEPSANPDKAGAKYINSPETPLYRKGDHLYGLHAARDAIRKRRQVVIVEGNFDVIALHQSGVDHCIAPMGTALTESQAKLLSRLLGEDGHVVLMLDGDRAGRAATMKDIFLFTEASLRDMATLTSGNLDVRIARLPDGEDPDTFAQKSPEGLDKAIRSARPAIDYVVDEALAQAETQSTGGRAKLLERLTPLLLSVRSDTARELHVDRVASALGVRPDLIWRQLEASRGARAASREVASPPPAAPPAMVSPRQPPARPASGASTWNPLAMRLFLLLGHHPTLLPYVEEEVLDALDDPVLAEMLRQARDELGQGQSVTLERLLALAPEEERAEVAAAIFSGKSLPSENPEQTLAQLCHQIRDRAIQREIKDLTQRLARLAGSGDAETRLPINQRIRELILLREQIRGLASAPATVIDSPAP
ncbi:MAG TPA: DNA primase [Pseudomonadota bacterium]|nr:DNA primase [Pseudomonadota bacterium]